MRPGVLTAAALAVALSGCAAPRSPLEDGPRTVDPDALDAAGCEEVAPGDLEDRDHLDPSEAPPASQLYPVDLPAAGPHFRQWSPLVDELPLTPMDVRALLHNMEHGAVVVWVNPDVVGAGTRSFVTAWRSQLGEAGFDHERSGASVFVSRVPGDVGTTAGVSLRAWGVAIDCPDWDLAAADAFVALHYGSRGAAPEAELGPYPTGNGVLVGPPGVEDERTTTV